MDKRQKFKGELRISRVRVFRLLQEQKYAGLGLPHCNAFTLGESIGLVKCKALNVF